MAADTDAVAADAAGIAAAPERSLSLRQRLIVFDAALSLLIHDLCRPLIPRSLLKTLEISGDGRLWFPVSISLLPFSSPLYFPLLLSLLLGLIADIILVGSIKVIVRRPRPIYNKDMTLVVSVDHWSFPSGHSSRVFFIACFLYLYSCSDYIGFGDHKGFVIAGVFSWAAATSISRVLMGRHFVFDVVAGASLGLTVAIFVHRFLIFQ